MTPTDDLQIVVWIEDDQGNYIDTAYITRSVGSYGLGNRPGMMEFNSGHRWPYGRRSTTFPVWSHKHGMTWPLVVFQNWEQGDPLNYVVEDPSPQTTPEENLSHPLADSSREDYYCRPLIEGEPAWDAESCATTPGVYTDKGQFHPSMTSRYPPRSDFAPTDKVDSGDAAEMVGMNPFDSVSRATPMGGESFALAWPMPTDLPPGTYRVWVEVAKEGDMNSFYSRTPYQEIDLMWGQYGVPYLGQPSVVYSANFEIVENGVMVATAADYAGYGDPDGIDGDVRVPDTTIESSVPGSGAGRLMLVADGEEMYRLRVTARSEPDLVAPGATAGLTVLSTTTTDADLTFAAAGDDGDEGTARSYEIRYQAGEPITEDNFADATVAAVNVQPAPAGTQLDFTLTDLLPRTNYYVAVRAVDECLNYGPIETALVTTPVPQGGEVDACFIATAAYGSVLADEVADLRRFRDSVLRRTVAGELFVEAYYTFGPSVAEVISPSQTLRALARATLMPVVSWARQLLRR
ncbi:MAG: fibronectin type III domain-containing protein [Deltaproteobacteria bacterium]|nr:fibronectin type III domain-containing protein [Deltaproteobacteria bacterium]